MLRCLHLLSLLTVTTALKFDLPSGKVKCFSEDLPSNTLVTGDFAAEAIPDGQNNMPIEIQVTDPFEKIIYTKDDISQGKFAFTTATTGDYIVCFHNKGGLEFMTQRRVSLVLKHGIDARDYSQVMKEEHLSGVQGALREMEDRLTEIRQQFVSERKREEYLRDLTETTCSRVMWFGVFTVLVCIGTSMIQYHDLFRVLKKGKYL
ncbi:hypothetical protein GUITHDRAFT_152203, partial [Guillardia theta CCMP2712]